jgi:hypothetical protein
VGRINDPAFSHLAQNGWIVVDAVYLLCVGQWEHTVENMLMMQIYTPTKTRKYRTKKFNMTCRFSFFFVFFFWWDCTLNSGLHGFEAGALSLESHL